MLIIYNSHSWLLTAFYFTHICECLKQICAAPFLAEHLFFFLKTVCISLLDEKLTSWQWKKKSTDEHLISYQFVFCFYKTQLFSVLLSALLAEGNPSIFGFLVPVQIVQPSCCFFSSLYNLKSLSDILIHRDVQAPWQQKKSWSFSCVMKFRPETISVPENIQAKPVPFLRSLTKQPSRKCRIATELTLTAAATVGGWWRSGGVEEEEVMNSPSGTKWIIQLYSTKTSTGAGIVCTIPSAVNNMTNSITPWNGEHAPTPLWFLLLICTIPCLRGIIHHLLFRLSFHVCLKHHMLSLE